MSDLYASKQSANLSEINSAGNAVMRVETTPQVANTRQSVRITTQYVYTGGLVIMDSVHMPTGCGTWPAFWSNGPNWPAGGEIDIVEGMSPFSVPDFGLLTDVRSCRRERLHKQSGDHSHEPGLYYLELKLCYTWHHRLPRGWHELCRCADRKSGMWDSRVADELIRSRFQ